MKKSNLYIERIYAEHPLSCWALDDDISFFQLLDEEKQDLSGSWWNFSNCFTSSDNGQTAPISNSASSSIELSSITSNFISRISSDFSVNSFNDQTTSACFSIHLYHSSYLIYEYRIGVSDGVNEYYTSYSFDHDYGWHQISHTFDCSSISNAEFFIDFLVYGIGPEKIKINGVSVGQWSENFNSYTIGFNEIPLDSSIQPLINNYGGYGCSIMDEYNTNYENNGIYLTKNNRAYVRPSGIPLAFGSYQSIIVDKAPDNNPSFIFPSRGMLNSEGTYKNYTFETWLRLINNSKTPVKIIGPINSTDGIYIDEGFIGLHVGPYVQSYFIGKWFRPILLHFEYSQKEISLLINGEKVISIDSDVTEFSSSYTFPPKDYDWWGVWGNDSIKIFEIDSIAIYPYLIPPETAKKHFVYGQGVKDFDFSNESFLKKTVQIDFPYAEYAYNVIYPDTMKWRSGFSNNINSSSTVLKANSGTLPEIVVSMDGVSVDQREWLLKNKQENTTNSDQQLYLKMNPMDEGYDASIYFKTLNVLDEKVESVYGFFKSTVGTSGTLMHFLNNQTGEKISIIHDLDQLRYFYIDANGNQTEMYHEYIEEGGYFFAGIDINKIYLEQYATIGSFFSSLDKISLKIGNGNQTYGDFKGRIFSINFNNKYFHDKKMNEYFINFHIVQPVNPFLIINKTANYSLVPVDKNISLGIDVGSCGYWEDMLPLSIFGKNIDTISGKNYDLDFIQFNIGTPYDWELNDSALNIYPYYFVATQLEITNYDDINALSLSNYNDFNTALSYETEYEGVKCYITLQNYADAGEKIYEDFTNIISADETRTVFLSTSNIDTKYEIFDNFIIIIPKDINFNEYYIGIHVEINSKKTKTRNVFIKRCELSSFVFNDGIQTKIGTKYAQPIYPNAVNVI